MEIEIIYATATEQHLQMLTVPNATTVRQALEKSGVIANNSELSWDSLKVGIFSRPVDLGQILQAGDRIEIYRTLLIDPKAARKQRVRAEKD